MPKSGPGGPHAMAKNPMAKKKKKPSSKTTKAKAAAATNGSIPSQPDLGGVKAFAEAADDSGPGGPHGT
jgi:hypothetical protein